MSRSIWKGPFVQTSLRKRIIRAKKISRRPYKKRSCTYYNNIT